MKTANKRYVDGYVLAVPTKNMDAYKKMASGAGKVWMKHGALEYFECAGDDMTPDMGNVKMATFPGIVQAKPNETVVFAFVVYNSKAHRDKVNALVMKDESMNDNGCDEESMPFKVERMAFGGFSTIVGYLSK